MTDVAELPRAETGTAIAPTPKGKGPVYHNDLIQGSDEWLAQRCGLITASEMRLILVVCEQCDVPAVTK